MKNNVIIRILGLFLLMSGSVSASVINIDVSDSLGTYSGTGAAFDTGTYWNSASDVNLTYSNLVASDGISNTDVDVTFRGWSGEYTWGGSNLVNDRFYGPSAGTSYIDITDLDAGNSYNLYLYASYWDSTYAVSGFSSELANPTSFSTPWVEGNQYVLLENIIADSLGEITVSVNAAGGGQWVNIAGLQIESVASAEVSVPATVFLMLLGFIGLMNSRKRAIS